MPPVDVRVAEPGKDVKISFIVLDGGVPTDPTSIVAEVFTVEAVPVSVALLTAVSDGEVGRYSAVWSVPRSQAPGLYRVVFTPDVGTADPVTFELFEEGHFQSSQSFDAASVVSDVRRISQQRDPQTFIAIVRTILRDHPQLNRLTSGRETSDGEIELAAAMAISQYNSVPPIFNTECTFRNFPSIAWLVVGTVGWIINSSYLLRQRNNLQYSDGGVTVDTENVAGYAALAQQWWGNYLAWIPEYKKAANLNATFGLSPTGVHSEYLMLGTLMGAPSYSTGILLR